jgi:hypothetical protein
VEPFLVEEDVPSLVVLSENGSESLGGFRADASPVDWRKGRRGRRRGGKEKVGVDVVGHCGESRRGGGS